MIWLNSELHKSRLSVTSGLIIFSLYTGKALCLIFLLQAFKIAQLFDADMEQGRGSSIFLIVPVLQWVNHLNSFIVKKIKVVKVTYIKFK